MAAKNGIVNKVSEIKPVTGEKAHPNLSAYPLIQVGDNGSIHLGMRLDVLEVGGGTEPHYHTDCDIFDHAFYVISGDVEMCIAGKTHRVGPDTLIYCQSNEMHSMRNVGTEKAKVLALTAAKAGDKTHGRLVIGPK
jgi:quercetin dioxygenase-like cupin family protein